MTRRDFITKGAMATAGTVLASPVRSNAARRHLNYIQEEGENPNPYVSNGLIHIWDAEWNVGWGQHDNNATYWLDLVGNNDHTLYGSIYFSDKALVVNSGGYTQMAEEIPSFWTIEYVCKFNATGKVAFDPMTSGESYNPKGRWLAIRGNGTLNFAGRGKATSNSAYSVGTLQSISVTYGAAVPLNDYGTDATTVYIGGAYTPISGSGMYGLGSYRGPGISPFSIYPMVGEMCCIRVYSRPLSEEEILLNYAIDKARFNLP